MTLFGIVELHNKNMNKDFNKLSKTYCENGKHMLLKYSDVFEARIEIDFETMKAKAFVYIQINNNKKFETNTELKPATINTKIIFEKAFELLNEKQIKIEDEVYEIPDFFNKKAILNKNEKVFEMIFFHFFNSEIHKELTIYKG